MENESIQGNDIGGLFALAWFMIFLAGGMAMAISVFIPAAVKTVAEQQEIVAGGHE